MDETREFPLLGWWIIVGFFGIVVVLGIIGTQLYDHNPVNPWFFFASVPFALMMAVGRKSVVNRQDKTVSTRYGFFGRYPFPPQNETAFDSAYLQLNRRYSRGELITYRTGIFAGDRHVEIDWQSLNFPSEVPNNVFDFLTWLNVPVQLGGEYEKYATEPVRQEVSKLKLRQI